MKFKVFLSSRNNDQLDISGSKGDSLTDIRLWLKDELEKVKLFNEDLLDIRINENFAADASLDSYNRCLQEVKDSDFLISIYNGAAGWAPSGIDLGICHAELSTALNISSRKFSIIDVKRFFNIKPFNAAEKAKNDKFDKYLATLNAFNNPLKVTGTVTNQKFKDALLSSIKEILYNHIMDRIKLSNIYYNFSDNSKASLDWKKLKYSDRNKLIVNELNILVRNSPNFSKMITKTFSIPDNMAVEDAKAYVGRPFLEDQNYISMSGKSKIGPIHFIGVYGNATETQVKNLIGYPDISSIRDEFGLYVWEQNTHIQLVFLVNCKTPEAINSNFWLFNNWCESNGELVNIKKRGEARYHILDAINEAKVIATK